MCPLTPNKFGKHNNGYKAFSNNNCLKQGPMTRQWRLIEMQIERQCPLRRIPLMVRPMTVNQGVNTIVTQGTMRPQVQMVHHGILVVVGILQIRQYPRQ